MYSRRNPTQRSTQSTSRTASASIVTMKIQVSSSQLKKKGGRLWDHNSLAVTCMYTNARTNTHVHTYIQVSTPPEKCSQTDNTYHYSLRPTKNQWNTWLSWVRFLRLFEIIVKSPRIQLAFMVILSRIFLAAPSLSVHSMGCIIKPHPLGHLISKFIIRPVNDSIILFSSKAAPETTNF